MKPPYAIPGTLPRDVALELVELSRRRLVEGRASARAWRIAATVWAQTFGHSRGWDTIYVEELGRLANISDRRDAGRAIKECAQLGAIEWEPVPHAQKRPSLVGLPGAPRDVTGAHHPRQEAVTGAHHPRQTGANHPHNKAIPREATGNGHVAGADSRADEPSSLDTLTPRGGEVDEETGAPTGGEPGKVRAPEPEPRPLGHLGTEELRRASEELGPTMAAAARRELELRARVNPLRATIERRFPPA